MPGGSAEDEVAPHEVVLIMLNFLRNKGLKNTFSTLLAEAKQHWTIVEPRPGSLRDLGAILQDYLRLRAEKLHNSIALKDSGLHQETLDFMEKISILVQDYSNIKDRALERVSAGEFSERRVRISGETLGGASSGRGSSSSSGAIKNGSHHMRGLPPSNAATSGPASSGYPGKKKVSGLHNGRVPPQSSLGGSSDSKSSSASISEVVGSMTAHLKQQQRGSSRHHGQQQHQHAQHRGSGRGRPQSSLNEDDSYDSLSHVLNSTMSSSNLNSRAHLSSSAATHNAATASRTGGGNAKNTRMSSSGSGGSDKQRRRQRADDSNANASTAAGLARTLSTSPTNARASSTATPPPGTTTPRRSRSGRPIRPPLMHGETPPSEARKSPTLHHDAPASASSKTMHLNDSLTFSNMSFSNASPIEKDCSTSRIRMTPLHDHEISLGPLENTSGSPIFNFDLDGGTRPTRSALATGDESLGSILDGNSLLGRSNISQMLRDDSSFNTNLHGSESLHGSTPLSVSDALRAASAGIPSTLRSTASPPKASSLISDASKSARGTDGHSSLEQHPSPLNHEASASNGTIGHGRRKRRITPSCISPNVASPPSSSNNGSSESPSTSAAAKRRKTSGSSSASAFRSPTARPRTKAQACGPAASGSNSKLGVDVDSFLSKVAYN